MADNNDGNDNAAASQPPSRPPRLHIIKLHESPHPNNNYERYDMHWLLDTTTRTAKPEIQHEDMLYIPELATGAGEMEGVRFIVGNGSNGFELLGGGIESPVFPQEIANDKSPQELRQDYERLLNIVLQEQGLSLAELFGGAEVVEEFWGTPDVERRPKTKEGEWRISWNECELLSTHASSSS